MDNRPVDRAALKRQLRWATGVSTLTSVRETVNDGKKERHLLVLLLLLLLSPAGTIG